jgi:putative phage-type endonuclease
MQIHNMEQGSEAWFEIRKLKMTASNATAIGANGAGLKTYITALVAEYLSSAKPERYTNEHIERGNELEAEARIVYELETSNKVQQVGFITSNDYVGCSPDGLVGDDGLVEIKCKSDVKHLQQLIEGEKGVESAYRNQMQMQMLVTGRKWCDYVCYNPNFKKCIYIHRFKVDDKYQEKLKEGLVAGELMIKEMLEVYSV